MSLLTDAHLLLAAAAEAAPEGIRAALTGGSGFAKDCHGVYVHPDLYLAPGLFARGQVRDLPGGQCADVAQPGYRVVYVRDCYPSLREQGGRAAIPSAAEITTWTEGYLPVVEAIYEMLLRVVHDHYVPAAILAADPQAQPLGGGDCTNVTLGAGQFFGPLGEMAWVSWPVVVAQVLP